MRSSPSAAPGPKVRGQSEETGPHHRFLLGVLPPQLHYPESCSVAEQDQTETHPDGLFPHDEFDRILDATRIYGDPRGGYIPSRTPVPGCAH